MTTKKIGMDDKDYELILEITANAIDSADLFIKNKSRHLKNEQIAIMEKLKDEIITEQQEITEIIEKFKDEIYIEQQQTTRMRIEIKKDIDTVNHRIKEISEDIDVLNTEIKELKQHKKIKKGTNLLTQRIYKYASDLKLSGAVQEMTLKILQDAKNIDLYEPPTSKSWIAGAIYIASIKCNERRTQQEFANIIEVSIPTISKHYKRLCKHLNIEIDV
jgi:transcription initiation factor TFIIIB Brf1 subunit/transcription initiation factor TFIIB